MEEHEGIILESVAKIEKEIADLEDYIATRQEQLDSMLLRVKEEDGQSRQTLADVIQERDTLKKRILQTEKLTDVEFSEIHVEVIKRTDNSEHKQFIIKGNSFDIPFILEFDTQESMVDDTSEVQIMNLTVKVSEEMVRELSVSLQSVIEKKCILGFFRLLVPYSKWHQYRTTLFNHFQERYPDFVTIEEADKSDILVICHPQSKQGLVLTISWEIDVKSICKPVPRIRLGVEAHRQLMKLDEQKTLEAAPQKFEDMVEEFGVEYAVDVIINLIKEQT